VLAHDPVGQITATVSDGLQQLQMIGLSEFVPAAQQAFPYLPPIHEERMTSSQVWTQNFPIEFFSQLTIWITLSSFVYVVVALVAKWRVISTPLKVFCFVILLCQPLNALICGGLSGPHERYQSRLTWLIPLAALLLYYQTREGAARGRLVSRPRKILPTI
jgi:hypothetical protein